MKELDNRVEKGFTLIELVVVILILSVLAATALPRFMNVQDKAHKAGVAAVAGSFGSAVSMVHAQWVANGLTGAANNVQGFGQNNVDVNAAGWPVDTNSSTLATAQDCVDIWNGIMQNPPSVAPSTSYTNEDWRANIFGAGGANPYCRYYYRVSTVPTRYFQYIPSNGNVTVVNP